MVQRIKKNKPKLRVHILVYAESDFYYLVPHPKFSKKMMIKWRLNKLAGKTFRYPWPSKKGLYNIVESLKYFKIPATMCIAGHLYLKKCNGWPHYNEIKPQNPWYNNKIGNDWYYWDTKKGRKKYSSLLMGDYIEKNLKNNNLFSFGIHGFAHECFSGENQKFMESALDAGKKAAKNLGINIELFGPPYEQIVGEEKAKKALKNLNIKYFVYNGDSVKFKSNKLIEKIIKKDKINTVRLSNYFEGTTKNSEIIKILDDIEKNSDKDAVYLLATHDFTHKNKSKLIKIFRGIKKLESEGKIKLCKLKEL